MALPRNLYMQIKEQQLESMVCNNSSKVIRLSVMQSKLEYRCQRTMFIGMIGSPGTRAPAAESGGDSAGESELWMERGKVNLRRTKG